MRWQTVVIPGGIRATDPALLPSVLGRADPPYPSRREGGDAVLGPDFNRP